MAPPTPYYYLSTTVVLVLVVEFSVQYIYIQTSSATYIYVTYIYPRSGLSLTIYNILYIMTKCASKVRKITVPYRYKTDQEGEYIRRCIYKYTPFINVFGCTICCIAFPFTSSLERPYGLRAVCFPKEFSNNMYVIWSTT